jgi:hypothetical protein
MSRLPQSYRVQIKGHEVAGRWKITEADVSVPASSPAQAIGFATRAAHARAGVPPWKPWIRESEGYATATLAERDPLEQLRHESDDDQPSWRA